MSEQTSEKSFNLSKWFSTLAVKYCDNNFEHYLPIKQILPT